MPLTIYCLGRQACTTFGTTCAQDATTAYCGHTGTKAMAALADKNTRLVGAFNDNAPSFDV